MTTTDLDWMAQARCRSIPTFTEMPELEQRGECWSCPVRLACLEYALDGPVVALASPTDHAWPVYGGLSGHELASAQRSRRQKQERARSAGGPRVSEKTAAGMQHMRAGGASWSEIADAFGVGRTTVRRAVEQSVAA